jgi:hypothetical protein
MRRSTMGLSAQKQSRAGHGGHLGHRYRVGSRLLLLLHTAQLALGELECWENFGRTCRFVRLFGDKLDYANR